METSFGDKLKRARLAKKLKQTELAKQLGVTNTTISNWENNVSKPDLDMLSYICGVLSVKVSYFLDAKLPADEISIPEFEFIKKYRELNTHGKEMVDIVLEKEYTHSTSVRASFDEKNIYMVNAAHERTDIEVTDEMRKHDDDIMDDDNF
jgi:repressor LexA